MEDGKRFATPQDEIVFWRSQAEKFKLELEENREELEEYQISSRELEKELETQLEQVEGKNRELRTCNGRLDSELQMVKGKLEEMQTNTYTQISDLQSDLAQIAAYKDELQKYIRELEQTNDDLERAKRATVVSLQDFEARLNQAIERNAFLENELDDKETLSETVQRLKDEARDLRQELDVRVSKTDETNNSSGISDKKGTPKSPVDTNKFFDSGYLSRQHSLPSSSSNVYSPNVSGGKVDGASPMPPSARVSALNLVGDMLRKLGSLETRLATCNHPSRDQHLSGRTNAGSPINSPRTKQLSRGASVPAQKGTLKISV